MDDDSIPARYGRFNLGVALIATATRHRAARCWQTSARAPRSTRSSERFAIARTLPSDTRRCSSTCRTPRSLR
jgi:hypothetical protein